MAIRDVVTMGFGNGTFSPGVSKVVTLGYAIADPNPPTTPGCESMLTNHRSHSWLLSSRSHAALTNHKSHSLVLEEE